MPSIYRNFYVAPKPSNEEPFTLFTLPTPTYKDDLKTFLESNDGIIFQKEVNRLIDEFVVWCIENQIEASERIISWFQSRFTVEAIGIDPQYSIYSLYTEGVPAFKSLLDLLHDPSIPLERKKIVTTTLIEKLDVCGPGIYLELADAKMQLSADPQIRLMAIRKEVADQVILNLLHQTNYYVGNETHYVNSIRNQIATSIGVLELHDESDIACSISEEIKQALIDEIYRILTPNNVITRLTNACEIEAINKGFSIAMENKKYAEANNEGKKLEDQLNFFGFDPDFDMPLSLPFDVQNRQMYYSDINGRLNIILLRRLANMGILKPLDQIYEERKLNDAIAFVNLELPMSFYFVSHDDEFKPYITYLIENHLLNKENSNLSQLSIQESIHVSLIEGVHKLELYALRWYLDQIPKDKLKNLTTEHFAQLAKPWYELIAAEPRSMVDGFIRTFVLEGRRLEFLSQPEVRALIKHMGLYSMTSVLSLLRSDERFEWLARTFDDNVLMQLLEDMKIKKENFEKAVATNEDLNAALQNMSVHFLNLTMNQLPENMRLTFLRYLGEDFLQKYIGENIIIFQSITQYLSINEKFSLIDMLGGREFVDKCAEKSYAMPINILDHLPMSDRLDYFKTISSAHLMTYIEPPFDLKTLKKYFQENDLEEVSQHIINILMQQDLLQSYVASDINRINELARHLSFEFKAEFLVSLYIEMYQSIPLHFFVKQFDVNERMAFLRELGELNVAQDLQKNRGEIFELLDYLSASDWEPLQNMLRTIKDINQILPPGDAELATLVVRPHLLIPLSNLCFDTQDQCRFMSRIPNDYFAIFPTEILINLLMSFDVTDESEELNDLLDDTKLIGLTDRFSSVDDLITFLNALPQQVSRSDYLSTLFMWVNKYYEEPITDIPETLILDTHELFKVLQIIPPDEMINFLRQFDLRDFRSDLCNENIMREYFTAEQIQTIHAWTKEKPAKLRTSEQGMFAQRKEEGSKSEEEESAEERVKSEKRKQKSSDHSTNSGDEKESGRPAKKTKTKST